MKGSFFHKFLALGVWGTFQDYVGSLAMDDLLEQAFSTGGEVMTEI